MDEHTKKAEVGRFIEFGNSQLKRIHLSREADHFVSTREVLACASHAYDNFTVIYADRTGLCSSSYIGLSNGISFLDKDELPALSLSSSNMPSYKWGDAHCVAHRLLNVLEGSHALRENTIGAWLRRMDDDLFCQADIEALYTSCKVYQPTLEDDNKISLFLNQKDFDRNRISTMKAGRAFKHMFQNMSDAQVAKIHDLWLDEVTPRKFTLKVGRSIEDFTFAYTADRVQSRNLTKTRSDYKSLAMSCMHGEEVRADFEGDMLDMSPASVYASGDFEIAYLVEENHSDERENKVAGRVIYSIGKKDINGEVDRISAPIYAACEHSGAILREHISKLGCQHSRSLSEWTGLKLLKIEASHYDTYLAPYLDGDISCNIGCKHLLLDDFGAIPLTNTEGLLQDYNVCISCDCSISDDETFYSDDGHMCPSCYDEAYGYCSVSGDTVLREDLIEVKCDRGNGRIGYDTVHMDYAVFCECVEEFWHYDDVTETTEGGEYVPTCKIEDFPELFEEEVPEDLEVA